MHSDDQPPNELEQEATARPQTPAQTSTDTIDLGGLYAEELSESVSFYVRVPIGKEEFSKLFQALPIPVLLLDQDGFIVFLNESCSKISSKYQSFVGEPFAERFYQGSAREEVRRVMRDVFETRRVKRVKTTLGTGKQVLWVRFHFRPLKMAERRYLLVLVEDLTSEKIQLLLNRKYQESLREEITQRIKAEQAIRRSESKYRLLFDMAPVGIIFLDADGRILFGNPKAAEIFETDVEGLSDRLFYSFLHEDDKHSAPNGEPGAASVESVSAPYMCRIIGDADTVKWIQINSVRAEWDGRPATLKFVEDVTKKRELEDEFVKMQKLDSLGLLAGGIAHDFNNILTAILGNISSGMNCVRDADQTLSHLSNAERACIRAKGLTQQLLTFSKGGVPIKKVSAMDGIINDSCEFALRGSNVSCRIEISDDLRAAEVDPAQISQVINNLVINANQAMPEGGQVTVRAENVGLDESDGLPLTPGRYVRVRVIDEGVGISDDILPHIFDPYFTTKKVGSGLGLATAYSVVKNHGGAVTVSSKPGDGSVFSVYLPASDRDPEPTLDLDDTPLHGTGRILVMDDDESVRILLKEALEQLGYDVVVAEDGLEAVELYSASFDSAQVFTAVILDLTVPGGMGGLEAADRIRTIDPFAKLIISSGYSNDPVMANHSAYGIDAVVPKPYTIGELTQALRIVSSDGQDFDDVVTR